MGKDKDQSNNDRSDSKNGNNNANKAARDNRSFQLNPGKKKKKK